MSDINTDVAPVDLSDSRTYVPGVPHEYLAYLRRHDPVHWQDEEGGPGFWAVTTLRRLRHRQPRLRALLARPAGGRCPSSSTDDEIAQQRLMMLNMDPPLHTRYRRLVNKGFTPRMVRDLEASIHRSTDRHHRLGLREGPGRLRDRGLGRAAPAGHRRTARGARRGPPPDVRLVEPHGRQRGPRVRHHRGRRHEAAMELYAYASELYAKKRIDPTGDLMSVLTQVEVEGESLSRHGARTVLPPPHGGRQRDHPEPHVRRHAHLLPASPTSGSAWSRTAPPARRPSKRCSAT